jgi:hypothetical protein
MTVARDMSDRRWSVPTNGIAHESPASRREITLLAVYFAAVIALTDIANVRLGVELLPLVVLLPAIVISRAPTAFLRDWWFFLAGLFLWNLSGPVAAKSTFPLHLTMMLQTDRAIFFGHDPVVAVQQLATGQHVNLLDWIASAGYNLHLPEPYIAGYFLWRLNRAVYFQFAAAALILLVLGLITFIMFPAIPPWMASERYGAIPGVLNRFSLALRAHPLPFHGTPLFYLFRFRGDAVAAFPSEHAAFPMLELLAFSRCAGKWVAFSFGLWVLLVLFTIVYLGEHWVTDALAGWAYAIAIFWAVRRFCYGSPA